MVQLQRLLINPNQFSGEQVFLTSAQQHYLSRVLRLQAGDRFIAINGQGQWWLAALTEQGSQARILEPVAAQTELPIAVTLLLAMPKSGLDEVVRQVTELGVAEIVLVSSQRTLLKPSAQKIDRWQRIAQEAAEQSERQFVPKIHPPQPWTEALQTWNASNSACYLCAARENPPHLLSCLQSSSKQEPGAKSREQAGAEQFVKTQYSQDADGIAPPPFPITLAIGPEGGWTDAEIDQAVAAGYEPVSLGSRILRAVTAPLVAMAIVSSAYESRFAE